MASITELQDYVKGKTIAIVGNSRSLLKSRYGEEIDQYDIVVRMNRGKIIKPEAQGTKTHICSLSSAKMSSDMIIDYFNPDYVMWATYRRDIIPDYSHISDKLVLHPVEIWKSLSELLGSSPSTGIISINFFVNYTRCKKITLYGFDFFSSQTFYNKRKFYFLGLEMYQRKFFFRIRKKKQGGHDGSNEHDFVCNLFKKGQISIRGYDFNS